jgi:uroporphyrinogen decarboxylase
MMTPKELLLRTLQFEEPEAIPHFEDIFEPVDEVFGLNYPTETELTDATEPETGPLIDKLIEIYSRTVDKYSWSSVYVWRPWTGPLVARVIKELKKAVGHQSLVGGFIENATWAMESVHDYLQFAIDVFEHRDVLKVKAQENVERALREGRALVEGGADIISLPNDWGYNQGLFMSRSHYEELVVPYLLAIIEELKKLGVIVVIHSDGYIMEILDIIADSGADMLQSIDPLANMDIAQVKKLTYGKIALQGNVNAMLLQNGTKEQVRESARYCLEKASPGGGYVFSSSNMIFKGAKIEFYDEMLNIYHDFNKSLK